jgi:subtilisin family serine protease
MTRFPRALRHGSGSEISLDPTHVLVAFKRPMQPKDVEALLRQAGLVLEDGAAGAPPAPGPIAAPAARGKGQSPLPATPVNHTSQRFWARTRDGQPIDDRRLSDLESILAGKLDWLGPVYRMPAARGPGGLLCPLPNALLIKPAAARNGDAAAASKALASTAAKYGLKEVPEKSKYLAPYRYFETAQHNGHTVTAYDARDRLLAGERKLVADARFEHMPMLVPLAVTPTDPLFAQQWDMTQISAGGAGTSGWDISTGVGTVVVCVLDSGCDLTHPDINYSGTGIDLGDMTSDGSPNGGSDVSPHGTCCAGIVAAEFSNAEGIAGVAGDCLILPVAFNSWTDAECAAGINWATANGANVISMSFGVYGPGEGISPAGWDFAIIDPAIEAAFTAGVVLCAATGNEDIGTYNRYPARHARVIACGASDQADNRKTTTSPDGEWWWGSNFGPELSVVAPGVLIPTTDRQGADGYNTAAGTSGDYFLTFNGTSSATPHVAGLAALVLSQYPSLSNVQVRDTIERTAEKVGTLAYATDGAFPNGTRNNEMGYGRINVLRALDLADVMIRDYSADNGTEPSTPPGGDFWDYSDIAIRITDDDVFVPDDPSQSKHVERGQTNYLYVRVTNNGARDARNVVVDARITPYVGLEFVYPGDWTDLDATHVRPTAMSASFASVPAGSSVIAKFSISSAQVEDLWGWVSGMSWHPCLLALVTADNDFAFASADTSGGGLVVRRNNMAQRNLSVINVLAGATAAFPFVAGNLRSRERIMEVVVDRRALPRGAQLLLELDADPSIFPRLREQVRMPRDSGVAEDGDDGLGSGDSGGNGHKVGRFGEDWIGGGGLLGRHSDRVVFLERTRLATQIGGSRGVLTLEAGSRFEFQPSPFDGRVSVKGGELIVRGDRRFVAVREDLAIVAIERQPGQVYPMLLRVEFPQGTQVGEQYLLKVMQRNQRGLVVGGASTLYRIGVPVERPAAAALPILERIAKPVGMTRMRAEALVAGPPGTAEIVRDVDRAQRRLGAARVGRRGKSRRAVAGAAH